ncbi:hypothetical protein BKA93DRAFT_341666 [Sparassis latifolia]
MIALYNALRHIRDIRSKIEATDGALSKEVFSTTENIPDRNLDNARSAIGLDFQFLVQTIRSVKKSDPLVKAYPDIHYNLRQQNKRRKWLTYKLTVPIQWGDIADGVYDDIPRIEAALLSALVANGISNP